jgi:diguanylate cyclase (GGDEF)-like protein
MAISRPRHNPRSLTSKLRWEVTDDAAVNSQDRATMARTFVYLFGIGGTLALVTLALPHSSDRWAPGVVTAGLAANLVAAVMLVGFDRLPMWFFKSLPSAGSVLITLVVASGGEGAIAGYATYYFWVVLSAFSFFSLRSALLNLAFAGVLYGVLLWVLLGPSQGAITFLMTLGTLTVLGLLVTALRTRVERLITLLRRRATKQDLVAQLGKRALAGDDLPTLYRSAAAAAAEGVEADHGAIFKVLPAGELAFRAGYGWDFGGAEPAIVPSDDPLATRVLDAGEPVVMEEYGEELATASGGRERIHPVASAIGVAIGTSAETFGMLAAYSKQPHAFASGDTAFMQALANILADSIRRRRAEDEIRHQALHDTLTGRPNRSLFTDRLNEALLRTHETGERVAVCFVDIDDFKLVNDSFGHGNGDELLTAFAARLRAGLFLTDTLARFGSDEFAILCDPVSDERQAVEIAERLRSVIEEPFDVAGTRYRVSASMGVAVSDESSGPDDLIAHADAAMYRAKAQSRGGYEVFNDELRARVRRRLQFEGALRDAPGNGELSIHLQPIVSLDDGGLRGCEALLRWRHPQMGPVAPAGFIPLAEESGAIVRIGEWVLAESCRLVAISPYRDTGPAVPLHLNVSARQLTHPGFAASVSREAQNAGIGTHELAVEITEHALLRDARAVVRSLKELRSMGVAIVLDDFGTGYSSLSHLKQFPIDLVKIDQLFVAGLTDGEKDEAIVAAVIGMADAFGLAVVGEGIERPEQAERLKALGCMLGQGYYFGPPTPPEDFMARFRPNVEPPRAGGAPQPAGDGRPTASNASSFEE